MRLQTYSENGREQVNAGETAFKTCIERLSPSSHYFVHSRGVSNQVRVRLSTPRCRQTHASIAERYLAHYAPIAKKSEVTFAYHIFHGAWPACHKSSK